ncbi:MAG: DNA methylase, partial [Lachnospiraceae bacterium]|nr:DNA methylase [Lachnospiraceae bacterium]
MQTEHVYIAIDLKSFYASMECVARGLDPLTANLVVADESRTEKTICLAVSPALKALGIPGRARLFEVEQAVKRIRQQTGRQITYVIASPRMERYIDVSADIYEIYLHYISAEDIHVYSIDECFMDVTQYLGLYQKTAYELARDMIYDV